MTNTPTTTDILTILRLRCGEDVYTIEPNIKLTVVKREGLQGLGIWEPCEVVTMTSDGRRYDRGEWHSGPEAESVYVERWNRDGRIFHGWIDRRTRRLVQAG